MIPTAVADSRRTRAARTAAAARWNGHPAVVVRLDSLTTPQARLVRALVAAAREANAEIPQD